MICPNCGFDNVPGSEQCQECMSDLAPLDLPRPQDRVESSLMVDPVSAVNPWDAVVLAPTTPVREAVQLMLQRNVGAVLVVDADGQLQGIFTERDLLTKVANQGVRGPSDSQSPCQPSVHERMDQPVSNFMTTNPEVVHETHTLAFALHKMDVGGYRHLPVIREGKRFATLSVRDMLRHITEICQGS